jgi:iron complex outermembrane receptor protein
MRTVSKVLGAVIALTGQAGLAHAQEAGASSEEIVVTAQRREERIQDAPVSVQAVQAQELQDRGVANLNELQRVSPQLTAQTVGASTYLFVRGVGATTPASGQFGSVALYVDGVYLGESTGSSFDIDSAEQVQVLAGPQGALFGRNATGGAIVIDSATPEPGDEFSVSGRASIGNFESRVFNLNATIPMGERAAGSLGYSRRTHDGYVENLNPSGTGAHNDDLDDRDSWSLNGAFVLDATDRLSFVIRGSHFEREDRGGAGFQSVGNDIEVAPGLNGTQAYYAGTLQAFGVPALDAFNAAQALVLPSEIGSTYDFATNGFTNGLLDGDGLPGSFNALTVDTLSLRIGYEFDGFELSSLTAWSESDLRAAVDLLGARPDSFVVPGLNGGSIGFSGNLGPVNTLQQDFQLTSRNSPIEWVAGVTHYEAEGDTTLSGDVLGLSFISAQSTWSVESNAVFAQATVPFGQEWGATFGARYTDESYELDDLIDPLAPTTLPGSVNRGLQSISDSSVTYTARLEYDNGPLLAYGGISTGFKGGALAAVNPGSPPVDPEDITSYEAGIKWELGNGLRINGAVFRYDYENIHVAYTDTTAGVTVLTNGTSAEVNGVELVSTWAVNEMLGLRFSGLWLDTSYDSDVPTTGSQPDLATGGNRLAGAPEVVVTAGLDLNFSVGDGELSSALDVVYSGGHFFEAENLIGTGGADAASYTTVDLSMRYQPNNANWWASVWGTNILDERYFQGGTAASGILRLATAAPPAVYGVSLGVDF